MSRLVLTFVVILLIVTSYHFGSQRRSTNSSAAAPNRGHIEKIEPSDPLGYHGEVKLVGPLANWMNSAQEPDVAEDQLPAPAPYQASDQDRVLHTPTPAPENLVHKTFLVRDYAVFRVEVPPGTLSALLTGTFQSFTTTPSHERREANLELLLFDSGGFQQLARGSPGSALRSTTPSPTQTIKWVLDSDYHHTKNYYFVFSNSGSRTELVRADFQVQFN